MSEEFARAIVKQSIARTAVAVGFRESSNECVDSLADIIGHFIEKVGENSVKQSEFAGRVHPGIQDVLVSFPGRGAWTEIRDFAFKDMKTGKPTQNWCQPFPHDLPDEFPLRQRTKRDRTLFEEDSALNNRLKANRPPFMESHFPALPSSSRTKAGSSKQQSQVSSQAKVARSKKSSASKSVSSSLAKIEAAGDAVGALKQESKL